MTFTDSNRIKQIKMKKVLLTIIIGLYCAFTPDLIQAQDQQSTLRERIAKRQADQAKASSGSKPLTVRAQIKEESEDPKIGNAPWVREIYSFLDLNKEENAPLYYPVKPIDGRTNLFNLIFKSVLAGDIDVYKYQLDGSERFTPEYKMDVDSSFFLTIDIPFQVQNGKYVVDPSDVPSEEIRGYYIKEAWYFDKNNSTVDVKTVAICPVLMYQEYDGSGMSRFPLFWLPYESIKPYTAEMPMMVSSLNNAWSKTINDFFLERNYDAEIYKTTNMTNRTLAEQFEGDSLKKEQQKIKIELKKFNEDLWVVNDSTEIADRAQLNSKSKKDGGKATSVSSNSESGSTKKTTVQKTTIQKNSSPARSMRNRKRN